jgi:hypothetical protein
VSTSSSAEITINNPIENRGQVSVRTLCKEVVKERGTETLYFFFAVEITGAERNWQSNKQGGRSTVFLEWGNLFLDKGPYRSPVGYRHGTGSSPFNG